jgi:hypothetical protein
MADDWIATPPFEYAYKVESLMLIPSMSLKVLCCGDPPEMPRRHISCIIKLPGHETPIQLCSVIPWPRKDVRSKEGILGVYGATLVVDVAVNPDVIQVVISTLRSRTASTGRLRILEERVPIPRMVCHL